jgi:hypothetical protein
MIDWFCFQIRWSFEGNEGESRWRIDLTQVSFFDWKFNKERERIKTNRVMRRQTKSWNWCWLIFRIWHNLCFFVLFFLCVCVLHVCMRVQC